jgi:hypothetical protein
MSQDTAKKPRMSVSPAVYKLPAHLTREIGRLIVHWAHFEYLLQSTLWLLLGIDEKKGRVAVPQARNMDETLEKIADLADLNMLKIRTVINKMKVPAIAMSSKRNLVAHGVWIKDAEGWKVQQTRGKYPFKVTGHSQKRSMAPEVIKADTKGLQEVTQNIDRLIQGASEVRDLVKKKLILP